MHVLSSLPGLGPPGMLTDGPDGYLLFLHLVVGLAQEALKN